jgi:hypothetical protein
VTLKGHPILLATSSHTIWWPWLKKRFGFTDDQAQPSPAKVLIKADNPKIGDDQIAFSVDKIRSSKAITGGEAATMGISTMTDTRWRKTRDFLVCAQLLKRQHGLALGRYDRILPRHGHYRVSKFEGNASTC